MTNIKKFTIITLFCVVIILLSVLFIIQNTNVAYALESNKNLAPVATYRVDGSVVTGDIVVERGTFITVTIAYGGAIYEPQIFTDTEQYAYNIEGNIFYLRDNSYIGGELLLYATIVVSDKEITLQPTTVVPVWEKDFSNKIVCTSSATDFAINFTDPDLISVKADIDMQDYGKTSKVLTNGSGLADVINIAKHGYAGLNINYDELVLQTYDNLGNVNEQTVSISDNDLNVVAYATRGLNGSGISGNEYKIATLSDLELVPSYDGSSKYFKQMNNITISSATNFHTQNFYGNYLGNLRTIYVEGLSSSNTVFCKDNYGTIRSLTFAISSFTTSGVSAGVVCCNNYGKIYSVGVNNSNAPANPIFSEWITGNYAPIQVSALGFGGITAINKSGAEIYDCNISIQIKSNFIAGGVASANAQGGKIRNCTVSDFFVLGGIVSVLFVAGGIVGNNNSGGYVYNCVRKNYMIVFNTASANTSVPKAGGIIANNSSSSSYVYGNTYSNSSIFNVEGYPNTLTSAQRVYIGQLYGSGSV